MNSIRMIVLAMMLIAANAIVYSASARSQSTPVPAEPAVAMTSAAADLYLPQVESQLDHYQIRARIDTDLNQIVANEQVLYVNTTGSALDSVAFRLYPNASYYGSGDLTIESAFIDGKPADPAYSTEDTAMSLPLAPMLADGDSVKLSIDFVVTIPENTVGSFGIFSDDVERGTLILSDWYPIVAGWEAGTGWTLDPPTAAGDPTFSSASFYDVELDVPYELTVVATGSEATSVGEAGRTRHHFVTGPVRDFAAVIDDDFVATSVQEGETSITFYAGDGTVSADVIDHVLAEARAIIESQGELAGAYPYREIDLVATELTRAIGVSWSGIIYFDAETLESTVDSTPTLQYLIAHELMHQWWGGIVGANSNHHGFMNESLASYTATLALGDVYGEAIENGAQQVFLAGPYLNMLAATGTDAIVDQPYTDAMEPSVYSSLVYGKGALGFMAIHEQIGDQAFRDALGGYASDFAFGIAEPEDLVAAFEASSSMDLDDLWAFWFEEDLTTQDDVLALFG